MLRRHTDTIAARSAAATSRALVLAGILVVLGLGMAVPMRSWLAQQAELDALRVEVEQAREQVADLEVQQQRWEDPAFIAAQARERLMLIFPGEIGYVAIDTTAPSQDPVLAEEVVDQAWFERLWTQVRIADRPARGEASEAGSTVGLADEPGSEPVRP
jgi:cell division protein FtsB